MVGPNGRFWNFRSSRRWFEGREVARAVFNKGSRSTKIGVLGPPDKGTRARGRLHLRPRSVGQHNLRENNSNGPGGTAPDINQPAPSGGPLQPKRPVQPFASIFLQDDPIFHSDGNALQVGLHKRFESGVQFNLEYEWIRVLGTENFVNPLTTNDSYGNIGGIAPQSVNVSYSYVLPFGQNRHFLASAGSITNKFVSCWEFAGYTQAPILAPQLPWEQLCIEAPSVVRRGDTYFISTQALTTTSRSR